MKDPLSFTVKIEDSGIRPQMQNLKKTFNGKNLIPFFCHRYRPRTTLIALILGASISSGCSFPGVYRINVQQGTIVTQDMLDQLKPGMTEKQIRYVLGTPSAPNSFDDTDETFVYSFQKGNGNTKAQIITIQFDESRHFTGYTGSPLEDQPAY